MVADRYLEPAADEGTVLTVPPALASWNKATDPDQLKLRHYLEHVTEVAAPLMVEDGPLALGLTVGLPDGRPLTEHRDLDNYLHPVLNGC